MLFGAMMSTINYITIKFYKKYQMENISTSMKGLKKGH